MSGHIKRKELSVTKYAREAKVATEREKLIKLYLEIREKLENVPAGGLTVGQIKEVLYILSSGQHPDSPTQHGGGDWLKEATTKMEKLVSKYTRQGRKKK